MYDRKVAGRELNFEASGALMQASLVMRDRETDSWWSIMTSDAIAGELDGTDLVELPLGEKAAWGDWKRRYPGTLVLSIEGAEHEERNPYDNYFTSGDTFRDMEVADQRLSPKTPIFTFRHGGKPYAVPYAAFEGGKLFDLGDAYAYLFRPPGAALLASTTAYLVPRDAVAADEDGNVTAVTQETVQNAERLPGFDTFWYSWVAVNEDTELLE